MRRIQQVKELEKKLEKARTQLQEEEENSHGVCGGVGWCVCVCTRVASCEHVCTPVYIYMYMHVCMLVNTPPVVFF